MKGHINIISAILVHNLKGYFNISEKCPETFSLKAKGQRVPEGIPTGGL